MNKTTYWELSDGRVLRVENSKRNDLVNDNPLLEAGCQAVLIRDERFMWLEMGGKYLADWSATPEDLDTRVRRHACLSTNSVREREDDYDPVAEEAEEFFTATYGSGVFVMCYYYAFNGEHVCRPVYFDALDTGWRDATAWLVVPDAVAVHTLLDNYTLWMNGCEVQVFDNETGELIEVILTCDHHEEIIHERYDMYATEKEDI